MVLACFWTKFQPKRSTLDSIRAIFDDLGPNRHCGPDLDLQDRAGDGRLEWVRPVPKAPERSWHASGPSFRPNRRFSTHFGPNLMFLDRTGTLVNQDWTWAEAWADLGLRPTLDDLGLRLGPILGRLWAPPDPPIGRPLSRPPKAGAPRSSLWSAAVAASEGQCLGSCPRSAKINMSSQDDLGQGPACSALAMDP